MSIIQTIRDKGSWVMVSLLVLALISFIFMDAGKRTSSLFGGSKNKNVGVINGTTLKQDEYGKLVDAISYAYKDNPQATHQAVSNAVWQMKVDENSMTGEFNAFDEKFSDKNLADMAIGKYGQPSQYVSQLFKAGAQVFSYNAFDELGRLDPNQAEGILKQLKTMATSNEDAAKFVNHFNNLLPVVKYEYLSNQYNMLLGTANYVPKWLVNKKLNDDNMVANISFVNVPYNEISDSTIADVKVTDNDISDYVSKNQTKFMVDDARDIEYTSFSFNPTKADSLAITNSLIDKKLKLSATPDSSIGNFIDNAGSMVPYKDMYVRKNEVLDSSINLVKGEIFGPFINKGSYIIGKVVNVNNYADSASARHVLIQTIDPRAGKFIRSNADAKKLVDSVEALYKAGVSFDSLAKKFSDDPGSKDSGGLYKNFALNTMMPEFNDFAFGKNAGEVGVIKTIYGYHLIKAEGTKGAAKAAYKIAYISKPIVPSSATKDSVAGVASNFASNIRTAKDFDDYFLKNPQQIKMIGDNINRKTLQINGLNDDTKEIAKWAFTSKLNSISDPIALDKTNKFVVSKLSRIQNEGIKSVVDVRKDMAVMNTLSNNKKYSYLAKKYESISSLEDIAAKTGKQIIVKDSVSFGNGVIPGMVPELRPVGYAFNASALSKVSGPIKGSTGVFFVKTNAAPYAKAVTTADIKTLQKQAEQELQRAIQMSNEKYKQTIKINDTRLENGF